MKKLLCIFISILILTTGCAYEFVSLRQAVRVYDAALEERENIVLTSSPSAHFGTSLNLAMRNPRTLNPLINQDSSVDRVLKLIFEPLVELRENMRPTPNLASRIVFSADGMSAVVTIREDAFWSDGVRITSGDVAFSVNVIRSPIGSAIYQEVIRDISAIEIIDSNNFRVRFSRPQGGMSCALKFPPIPRHYYYNHTNFTSARNMMPVGSGVYRVDTFESAHRLNLVPNENRMIGNRPYIEQVTVFITDNEQTDFTAFEQGIINVFNTEATAYGRLRGQRAITTTTYDTNNLVFLGFNFRRNLMDNRDVREAIAHAVDRVHIQESIYLGRARVARTIINPVSYLYHPNTLTYEFNMEQARNILFRIGARHFEGALSKEISGANLRFEFRILVNEESPERVAIARNLRYNLEELGMIVHLDIYDFETYLNRLESGNFDMFLGAFNFFPKPDFKPLFHSSNIGAYSYNHFSFRSEAADELLEQIDRALTEDELWSLMRELKEAVAYELPMVPIVFTQRALLTDGRITGEHRPVMNNIFNNIAHWRIEWAN